MTPFFELFDTKGRHIILTKERWSHICRDHPQVELEEIEKTLITSIKIIKISEEKEYYFHYF